MKWRGFLVAVFALVIACGESQGATGGERGNGASNGTGGAGASNGTGGSVPPGESFSVKWGPIEVPSGADSESTQCVVKRIGNAGRLFVNEIHNVLGATSHHFIVYRVNDTVERPDPFACDPFADTFNDTPLIITQRADDRLRLPQGVAYALEPNQMVRLELHYINVSAAPQMAEATSTFVSIDESDVENEADIMFMGDTNIDIPKMSLWTLGPSFLKVPIRLNGVSYFAITGHEHKRGTDVYVETTAGPGMPATPVYDVVNFRWDEPETVTFDPPFKVPDGGGFSLTCSWNNASDSPVFFGTSVDDEMCFFWAYYYPSQGPVVCANGLIPCN